MDTPEFAWFVGLFEGEGSIVVYNREGGHVNLQITMTDRDVLEKVVRVTGAGKISGPRTKNGCKPQWTWKVSADLEVLPLLQHMRPLLMSRRSKKADEALRLLKGKKYLGRTGRHPQDRCKRGHRKGPGKCKVCARLRQRKYRLKLKTTEL